MNKCQLIIILILMYDQVSLKVIQFCFRQKMNRSTTSPYRPTGARSNIGGNTGSSQPIQLMVRNLEKENNNLVEEIGILRSRTQKVGELEDKIDLVLKHNTQLLNENQRLAKLINQKKSETELWKNKFESLGTSKNASTDLEIKRLLNEIQKLKEEICQIEHIKNLQINQIKNQNHLEIQNIKRTTLGSAEKYELEIRKLKEYCDKKQYQISQLNMKYVRLNKETDFQISKLKEEKQRLKSDLMYEETQHRREVDSLKSKFDFNFHTQLQNLKKQHLNQIEAMDYENTKLKEVIHSKNVQIDQIFAKNTKVKGNYEDSLMILQKQNDDLKNKIVETEHIAQLQLNNLREKLQGIKQSEISMLKGAHANQIELLTQEIKKLNKFLNDRNVQMQIQSKQNNQMRVTLESDVIKAKAQLEAQITQNREAAINHEQALRICDYDLKSKNQEMKTVERQLQAQINILKSERQGLNRQLNSKEDELGRERSSNFELKRRLQNEVNNLKDKLNNLKDQSQRNSRRSSTDFDEAKKLFDIRSKQYQSKIKGIEDENKQKDKQIKELKENIQNIENQVRAADEKNQSLQNCQKNLRREAREALARWDAKQKQYNNLIKQQINSMERSKKREVDELKGIYQNKISSLKHHLSELEKQILGKNKLLNDLKLQYQNLYNKFEEVFSQKAAQKDLDIKIPGWVPQTIATKNLFDVFLKNKVIEYCS